MNFRAFWAFWKRDMLEQWSYKAALGLDALGILSNLLIFYFIAKLLPSQVPSLAGYQTGYFPFVLTGIAFSYYQISGLTAFPAAIQREQDSETLETVFTTRAGIHALLMSSLVWELIHTTFRVALFFLIGRFVFQAAFPFFNLPLLVFILGLMIVSFSGLGLVSAGFVLLYKKGDPVSFFISAFSRFLSGIYFPLSILPPFLQKTAALIPFTHGLDAIRRVLLANAPLTEVRGQILALVSFAVVLLPAGLVYFRWALRKAKKRGTLAFR